MKKKEIRELQDLLRAGGGIKRGVEYTAPEPAETVIVIQMPDRSTIGIKATDVTIEFNRDFVDVTSWRSPMKTYTVGPKTFTIKGKM